MWSDPRFLSLSDKIGRRLAIGTVIDFWRIAQSRWAEGEKLISESQFKIAGLPEVLFEVELAVRTDHGIYAKGAEKNFGWLSGRALAGRAGGSVRSEKKKTAALNRESLKREKSAIYAQATTSKPTKPQASSSSSSSSSNKNTNTLDQIAQKSSRFDRECFEEVYKNYPRKAGKTPGLKKCAKEIKTAKDLEDLSTAINNYSRHCDRMGYQEKYIKHFSSFMSEWRDWIDPATDRDEEKMLKMLREIREESEAKNACQ